MPPQPSQTIARPLLRWFDRHRRDLPWRRDRSPYRTLVSELMLQQTTVATVIPYFERFVARFPDFEALAAAPEDDVLASWSGLGYYSRARNLHRAARAVVEQHGGHLPGDVGTLRTLPGVGPYTAAAVAAIAFGARAFALDGNAARVVARIAAVRKPIDDATVRAELTAIGTDWVPHRRAGDFAEAIMELGATVCTSRAAECASCPVKEQCLANARGLAAELPVRRERVVRKSVRVACARIRAGLQILLVRRGRGLLAGTWSLPEREIAREIDGADAARACAQDVGLSPSRVVFAGSIRHVFTHRDVVADVFDVEGGRAADVAGTIADTLWAETTKLNHGGSVPVSSFLRKMMALAPAGAAAGARDPARSRKRSGPGGDNPGGDKRSETP